MDSSDIYFSMSVRIKVSVDKMSWGEESGIVNSWPYYLICLQLYNLFQFYFLVGRDGPPNKAKQFSRSVYVCIYTVVARCQLVSTEKAKHLL